ncbi:hypothetical protein J2T57_001730 [Natronocella acetinitrilica]|uniref:Uncharacterized protein n=1 Tax=Natronocella acetinitrilica TaxID=414046 RepID=A0AAE3KC80_9GAMM|nr:hypothetical protein [Natronocella acetinitrilica]MCP1674628.1 hypothetical protein [Natronocella acetinitrilica]
MISQGEKENAYPSVTSNDLARAIAFGEGIAQGRIAMLEAVFPASTPMTPAVLRAFDERDALAIAILYCRRLFVSEPPAIGRSVAHRLALLMRIRVQGAIDLVSMAPDGSAVIDPETLAIVAASPMDSWGGMPAQDIIAQARVAS